MPKGKPKLSMMVDVASLSKLLKKPKGKAGSSTISQYDVAYPPSHIIPTASEEGSQMVTVSKKPAKTTPEEASKEKFDKILDEATLWAKKKINGELLKAVLRDRVRMELTATYGVTIPAQDIERYANDAARQLSHELREIPVIPEGIQHAPIFNMDLHAKHHVAEPSSLLDDDYDD